MIKVKKLFMVVLVLAACSPIVSQTGSVGYEVEVSTGGCGEFPVGLCRK